MRKLLVGVDLSQDDPAPVRWGRKLSEWSGLDLSLVHVVEKVPAEAGLQLLRSRHPDVIDRLVSEAKEEVLERLRALGEEGFETVPIAVRIGRPSRELTAEAAAEEDAVLVLGAGRRRWTDALLGTTTDRVLRISSAPVLIARGAVTGKPTRILAAVDLSESAGEVIREAARWARALEGSLTVFHVPQPRWANAFLEGRREHVLDEMFEDEGEMRSRAEREVRELTASLQGAGTEVDVEMGEPGLAPAEAIAERLERGDVDLLVTGTHGVGGVDRWILGSVAESLAHSVSIPLVVVPVR